MSPLPSNSAIRPFALVQGQDHWRRASHSGTSLHPGSWSVQLDWEIEAARDEAEGSPAHPAGLAFDPWCRLYHSLPEEGQIERVLWAGFDPLRPLRDDLPTVELFRAAKASFKGEFAPDTEPSALRRPQGLAVDEAGRLFVAERGAARVLVFDLVERRLIRSIRFGDPAAPGPRPLDLASHGRTVYAALEAPAGLARFEAHAAPRRIELPEGMGQPSRVAVSPGGSVLLLIDAGSQNARIVPLEQPGDSFGVPSATDLEILSPGPDSEDELVIARLPGQDFLRFALRGASRDELPPLKARGYDGAGIVATPDGRIGFQTPRGFRTAVAARLRYLPEGRVVTFRLDSDRFQTVWGRLFVDACIPQDTDVRVAFISADEPPEGPLLARVPPANTAQAEIRRPDLSPPMPPLALVDGIAPSHRLHRRETGVELPWLREGSLGRFRTYEAPIQAPPGRYLWAVFKLTGNTRFTPRIKQVRAEYPSHDLLRRLPRIFSRQAGTADFLRRYLAMLEGAMGELDARALARRALLDPRSVPEEMLAWLSSLVGLVQDERWPEQSRRTLLEEAIWLFRFRGTVAGLTRMLEIYLGRAPVLIEHFKVRGLGGAIVGGEGTLQSSAVLGAGFRVGGAVGVSDEVAVAGEVELAEAIESHAHRFSVVIGQSLTSEQRDVVDRILDVHRPAHTIFDLCTLEAGMRAGMGLYLGLTSLVGCGAGFEQLRLGSSLLGRNDVLGRPRPGFRVGDKPV